LTLNQPGRWRINSSHINFFLEELLILAKEYELEEIVILSAVLAQNYSLCPYCRSRLDDQKQAVVSCKNCSTPIHESCWNENGLCTTWGCGSILSVVHPGLDYDRKN
jgi:Prokaryotic RING finger family 1